MSEFTLLFLSQPLVPTTVKTSICMNKPAILFSVLNAVLPWQSAAREKAFIDQPSYITPVTCAHAYMLGPINHGPLEISGSEIVHSTVL